MMDAEIVMSHVIEVDETGAIVLPRELVHSDPRSRYSVEVTESQIVLKPVDEHEPFWKRATPQEWVDSVMRMVDEWEKLPPGPSLTNEALRRENMYD
jgi:hypothetical protein